jgi:hypothetical protein
MDKCASGFICFVQWKERSRSRFICARIRNRFHVWLNSQHISLFLEIFNISWSGALAAGSNMWEGGPLGRPTWQKRGTAPVTRPGGGEGGAGQTASSQQSYSRPGAAGRRQSRRLPATPGRITTTFRFPLQPSPPYIPFPVIQYIYIQN